MGLTEIRDYILSHGYDFEVSQINGKFQKVKDQAGHKIWYIGTDHGNDFVTFTFGDFRDPDKKFTFVTKQSLSSLEQTKLERFNKRVETDKALKHELTQSVVQGLWRDWSKISLSENADYLKGKQIPRPPDVIVRASPEDNQKILVVPLRDPDGELWNIQQIYAGGDKTFHPGAKVKGCFYTFGQKITSPILIGEGFATCAAAHLSTGLSVVCAFNISNLEAAIRSLLGKGVSAGEIVLLADYDGATYMRVGKNPGMLAVQKLTKQYKVGWVAPCDGGENNVDFADIFKYVGMARVVEILSAPRGYKDLECFTYVNKNPVLNEANVFDENSEVYEEAIALQAMPAPGSEVSAVGAPSPREVLTVKSVGAPWVPLKQAILTRNTGFHETKTSGKSGVKYEPVFTDLRAFFQEQHPFVTHRESEVVYAFDGKQYKFVSELDMHGFAEKHFDPKPTNGTCREFQGSVTRYNVVSDEFFDTSKKINFQNGWLDLRNMEFAHHSPDVGFKSILDYGFDPAAQCPEWEAFLGRVLSGDSELIRMVMEFLGYVVSGDECWTAKALVLKGEGANGKSTFLKIVRALVGKINCMAAKISDFKSEYYRQQLDGKLVCISEETPKDALIESSYFKDIVAGGTIGVRAPYGLPYNLDVRTKLLFSCNDMPPSGDLSPALLRRLLIVPFNAVFTDETADPFIAKKLLVELPGILNYALWSYLKLSQRGRFEDVKASRDAVAEYALANNPLAQWMEEYAVVWDPGTPGYDALSSSAAMYRAFAGWAEQMGYQKRSLDWFSKQLLRLTSRARSVRIRLENRKIRGVHGVTKSDGTPFRETI